MSSYHVLPAESANQYCLRPEAIRVNEVEFDAAGTGVTKQDIYFPKNQVTPNMKLMLFMPEFG